MPKNSLLGRPGVRKLLLAYGVAMVLVLAYFVLRTLVQEEREMEYLEFNTRTIEAAEQNSSAPAIAAPKRFMLLPR